MTFDKVIHRMRKMVFDANQSLWKSSRADQLSNAEQAIRELYYKNLNYPNQNHYDSFLTYLRLGNFAYHSQARNILEIGSGLSTAIWTRLALTTQASFWTIDADFKKYEMRVEPVGRKEDEGAKIHFLQGVTVSRQEMERFYITDKTSMIGNVPVQTLCDYLDPFYLIGYPWNKYYEWRRAVGRRFRSINDLISLEGGLTIPRPVLDVYSQGHKFSNELAMVEVLEQKTGLLEIDNILPDNQFWDLIFFDSGEMSSIIEWNKIHRKIAVGGLAAFHDIYFPKSIKNCIVCASILADPAWKIVYTDNSTNQGLLVAQKIC